jgi:hypothetical protein
MPALKQPQWTVEVPIYFFVGGMAGAASVIGAVGHFSSSGQRLIRNSRWIAAIGGLVSPPLLISDLGVPSRFLNMLRVFKIQSPMSVGSWTLVAFSNSAAAAAVFGELETRWPLNQCFADCFCSNGNDSVDRIIIGARPACFAAARVRQQKTKPRAAACGRNLVAGRFVADALGLDTCWESFGE